jgi:hypothetical protein
MRRSAIAQRVTAQAAEPAGDGGDGEAAITTFNAALEALIKAALLSAQSLHKLRPPEAPSAKVEKPVATEEVSAEAEAGPDDEEEDSVDWIESIALLAHHGHLKEATRALGSAETIVAARGLQAAISALSQTALLGAEREAVEAAVLSRVSQVRLGCSSPSSTRLLLHVCAASCV